jgi:U3 small nucleolar RNA-associated protein 3
MVRRKSANAPELRQEDIYDEADMQLEDGDLSFMPLAEKRNIKNKNLREIEIGSDSDNDDDLAIAEEQEARISSAWGKRRDNYYDQDSLDEEDDRELEEEEVKRLRQERISTFDEDVFEDDMLGSLVKAKKSGAISLDYNDLDDAENEVVEVVEKDLSVLSKEEKLEFLKEHRPELFQLLEELGEKTEILEEEVLPALQVLEDKFKDAIISNEVYKALLLRKRLCISYCQNLTFCLMMIAQGKDVKDHPVAETLEKLDQLLDTNESVLENMESELVNLLEGDHEAIMSNDNADSGDSNSEDLEFEAEEQDSEDEFENENSSEMVQKRFVDDFEIKEQEAREAESNLSSKRNVQNLTFGQKKVSLRNSSLTEEFLEPSKHDEDDFEIDILKEKRPIISRPESKATSQSNIDSFDPFMDDDYSSDEQESSQEIEEKEEIVPSKPTLARKLGPSRPDPDFIEGRRAITKTIMKNQGLKRYRKRDNKNPRLKHRNKYEKEVKKRNALVKQYQGKIENYGGESTGIKDYVIRSTKLRN